MPTIWKYLCNYVAMFDYFDYVKIFAVSFFAICSLAVFSTSIMCGIISAVVASNKGRNGLGWFVLGLLLGPWGLILALVVSKEGSASERRIIQAGNTKKCPHCAELIKSEAVKCRYCGSSLDKD